MGTEEAGGGRSGGAAAGGRLVVCPTPIGNLGDVTLRVLEALRSADVVACEDTRRTRVLLDRYEIRAQLVAHHEHNERARAAGLAARVAAGERVALVSDAGMPVVSDPGHALVSACIEAGLTVEVLPGASATLVALVASGLPSDAWRFVGFLPRKRGALEAMLGSAGETLVAFESPRRLVASLEVLAGVDAARRVAVCRELTKVHEEVVRGTVTSVLAHFAAAEPRGEIVVVMGAAAEQDGDLPRALDAMERLVAEGARARGAAGVVAELTGVPVNALYRAHLARG